MSVSQRRLRERELFTLAALGFTVACVLPAAAALIWFERTGFKPEFRGDEDAFLRGAIGMELMARPAPLALGDIFPRDFLPRGPPAADWIDQYGLVCSDSGANATLPIGFVVSKYRPQSGSSFPVPLVGVANASCRQLHDKNRRVLTFAELIKLKKRRNIFYRGRNRYDYVDIGFDSFVEPEQGNYLKFAAALECNTIAGDDYPWRCVDPKRNVDNRLAPLAYLKIS